MLQQQKNKKEVILLLITSANFSSTRLEAESKP